MKKLQVGLVLLAASYCSYSFSNTVVVNGTTSNAAANGYNWVMQNVLPQQAGLEVNNIIYRYTAVKDPTSDMIVYVQNEDAQNPGQYIFREADDWSQKPGRTIYKVLPQPDVRIERWGNGSIEVEGEGQVENAVVTYDYRYDPCFDPQSNPSCPGYTPVVPDIPEPDLSLIYDQNDKFIEDNEKNKVVDELDKDEEEERARKRSMVQRNKERLEVALGSVNSALMTAEAQAQFASLMSLSILPDTYTAQTIPLTIYEETIVLKDANLPDNPRARRVGLAQQLKHEKMVNSQYEKEVQ
jgi:hypothetical protein